MQKSVIIGRNDEIKLLQELIQSNQPELLAVYGRRRIGKTYLIKNYYASQIVFHCSGELGATTQTQLANFVNQLNTFFPNRIQLILPQNWQEAFGLLRERLEKTKPSGKKVLFFDELPWLDTHKSGFISAFSYFWNMYLSQRPDIIVVICGSAASWMIKKIINNKGGLHNRVTRKMQLFPFTLEETKNYLRYRKINLSDYQILQLYMIIGGIPHYLNAIQRGLSLQQNIDAMCFAKNGQLTDEFNNLYAALFSNHAKHITVVRTLAKKNKGLTRNELLTASKLETGGGLTEVLEELIASGFVQKTDPYHKKTKESLFRLMDEFSLFYFKFMRENNSTNQWLAISKTSGYTQWCGYAFENACFRHIQQIKKAIGISAVHTTHSSWTKTGNSDSDGAQIDLLLNRADDTINICEIKFSKEPFVINKQYNKLLQNKLTVFRADMPPRKTLLLTFITTFGVANNDYKHQTVDSEITLEALFA